VGRNAGDFCHERVVSTRSDRKHKVNPAPSATIPVLAFPPQREATRTLLAFGTTTDDGTDFGTPTGPFSNTFSARENSEKTVQFFTTRSPTRPCARMNTIHFPRLVIHKHSLLRALRGIEEKFPDSIVGYPLIPFRPVCPDRRRNCGIFRRAALFRARLHRVQSGHATVARTKQIRLVDL
jgi:hypothetical protein